MTSSSNTDDDALTPALVAGLESGAHHVDISSAVKGVVTTTVSHLNQLLLNGLVLEVVGVDKVSRAKLVGPLLLGRVDIDDDDLAGLVGHSTLNDGETDAASTEDSNVVALLDVGGDGSSTVTGGDTAAEKAGSVHRSIVLNGNDGDIGDDGVLGEGGGSHEVEEILALALEAAGAVRHDTLALGRADLAAEVGLSRLAELALLALGCATIVSFGFAMGRSQADGD